MAAKKLTKKLSWQWDKMLWDFTMRQRDKQELQEMHFQPMPKLTETIFMPYESLYAVKVSLDGHWILDKKSSRSWKTKTVQMGFGIAALRKAILHRLEMDDRKCVFSKKLGYNLIVGPGTFTAAYPQHPGKNVIDVN